MSHPAYPVDDELASAIAAHTTLVYLLLAVPLLTATHAAGRANALFGGGLAVLAPLYYLGVLGIAVAPSVQSVRSPPSRGERSASEGSAVGDLKRRYVGGELTEREFENQLERVLETER